MTNHTVALMMTTPKPRLTVALIVQNEADKLPACLDSVVGWADEIVVIDSGSQDGSQDIARRYGAQVHEYPDWPGFGKQRQRAQSHVQTEWVLWLDADERVSSRLQHSIQAALARHSPTEAVVFELTRFSWAFGRFIRPSGWYPDQIVRLYPTRLTGSSDDLVHESVQIPNGTDIIPLSGDLLHYTFDDFDRYLSKQSRYAHAWAVQKQQQGKTATPWQGVRHALFTFVKMYALKRGFMDGKQGLLLAVASAQFVFFKYAQLWVRTATPSAAEYERQHPTD